MSEGKTKKGDLLLTLRDSQELFILYSAVTKCPYVICDPETFDDFASLYVTEAEAKAAWGILHAQKIPVNVVKLENQHFLVFYTSLYTMGINAVALTVDGDRYLLQLGDIVKRAKPEEKKDGTVWVENPEFHLTALYLTQAVRKTTKKEPLKENQNLLEEAVAHFSKGRFIQPVRQEPKSVPLLQLPNGEKYQPIFTDILEFQKFNKEGQFQPLVAEASNFPKVLAPGAVGVVVNPLGVNLPLKIMKQESKPAGAPEQKIEEP